MVQEQATTVLHVSPDGRWLLWVSIEDGRDIWFQPLDGSAEARPLIQTSFNEDSPAVSPDGRWIAYVSDDSGERAIYIEPFPDLGQRFKLTTGGAQGPVWAPNGSRLYYRQYNGGQQDLVVVDVLGGDRFGVGASTVLFTDSWPRGGGYAYYDVHPDETGFVVVRGVGQVGLTTGGNRNVVITNALNVGVERR